MRLALEMHECTEAAAVAVATSLSSDARAAAASVSACICAKSAPARRSSSAPPVRVANWSIMSTARTTAWPQTTKLSATRRRLASRRSRSGSAGASGASTRVPSIETLTSTTGSSVCGLSYSSGAASASSCGVATPHRWRHASPRRALDFISTRTTSLTCRHSASALAGVQYGSACAASGSLPSSAHDSKTVCGRKSPLVAARACASASCAATRRPATPIDRPTTTRAGTTMKLRAMPVSASGNAPSLEAAAARLLTASKTRMQRARGSPGMPAPASSSRCVSASTMPGSSLRSASRGVVLRTARLHTSTPALADAGCSAAGAREHACSVVLAASVSERTSPTWHAILLAPSRRRHVSTCGTWLALVTTRPAVASADLIAFSAESVTSSWLPTIEGAGTGASSAVEGAPALAPAPSPVLLLALAGSAWPESVSIAAAAASARDCVMKVRKIDVHFERSAAAHHGAIWCAAFCSAVAAVTTVAVRGFFEASTSSPRACRARAVSIGSSGAPVSSTSSS